MAEAASGQRPAANELDFGIITPQHWRSWDEVLEQWHFAAETGWDSAWVMDHFMSMRDGELGPCLEGWTLLAGLAARVPRVRLGVLVTGNTHRNPAILAKQAVTVDHISGGRLILGIGAAWNAREHAAYGLDFPPPRERVDRFGEALALFRLLETEGRATFAGRFYRLDAAPFAPKPVHGRIPVMIGTRGRRMLRHVARYADRWESGGSPEDVRALGAQLDDCCRAIGRDPGAIRWAFEDYGSTIGEVLTSEDRFRQHVTAYAAAGVRSFLFNLPGGPPNPTLRAIAARVIPDLRAAFAAGELA